jgi:DNA polymerase III subunit epsilon
VWRVPCSSACNWTTADDAAAGAMSWWRKPAPVDEQRWVVLDVETSGLDARRDRLLAIAAIAVQVDWARKRVAVAPGDSIELVLRQDEASSHDNILLHGIGMQSQRQGQEPAAALGAFVAFAGHSPLLAFHSAFDEAVIKRHLQMHAGALPKYPLPNPWADIEHLCAVTHEKVRARALDEWLAHFGIHCAARHQAAADTLAECELLQRIWPRLAPQCNNWRDVEKLARQQGWIARG